MEAVKPPPVPETGAGEAKPILSLSAMAAGLPEGAAIAVLQEYGISQLPVSEAPDGDELAAFVGSITEKGLLERAFRDPTVVERTVGEVMDRPLPLVEATATLDEAFALLSGGAAALVAFRGNRPVGVVTKLDFLEYLAHRPAHGA